MRLMKWTGILAAVLLIISCCFTWVIIPSENIIISGIDAKGTYFGKPGYFHFVAAFFFLVFTFIPRIWTKRSNLLVAALNLAWAIRNFFLITMCRGGECPEKHIAIYLVIITSLLMMASAMVPDLKLKSGNTKD
jgi:hypothetical protein